MLKTEANRLPSFAELQGALQGAQSKATAELAATRSRLEREMAQAQRTHAAAMSEAQNTFDTAIAESEKLVAAKVLGVLSARSKTLMKEPTREAMRAYLADHAELRELSQSKLGRELDSKAEGLAIAMVIAESDPTTIQAFASQDAWGCIAGMGDALHKMRQAALHPENVPGALAAFEALEARARHVARARWLSAEQASRHWELLISGKTPRAQEDARAELAKEDQRVATAEWERHRDLARRVRAGDAEARRGLARGVYESFLKLDSRIFGPLGKPSEPGPGPTPAPAP